VRAHDILLVDFDAGEGVEVYEFGEGASGYVEET